jgi:hypothetical protein
MILSLESDDVGILRAIPVAIMFSVLSIGFFVRGRLYFYVLSKSQRTTFLAFIKSRVLLNLSTCFIISPAFYGLKALDFWWIGVISILINLDLKNDAIKAFWPPNPTLINTYAGIHDIDRIPRAVLIKEGMAINLLLFTPILTVVFSNFYRSFSS